MNFKFQRELGEDGWQGLITVYLHIRDVSADVKTCPTGAPHCSRATANDKVTIKIGYKGCSIFIGQNRGTYIRFEQE